jgi:uncharacterized Zn finger protein
MAGRGKKGKVGERRVMRCPKCGKDTWHKLIESPGNPDPKYWWECEKCGSRKHGRKKEVPSED